MNVSGGREEEGGWNARTGPNLRLQPGLFEDLRLQGASAASVWRMTVVMRYGP